MMDALEQAVIRGHQTRFHNKAASPGVPACLKAHSHRGDINRENAKKNATNLQEPREHLTGPEQNSSTFATTTQPASTTSMPMSKRVD